MDNNFKEVKISSNLIPICAACKKIRDVEGNWHQIEDELLDYTKFEFTHGICSDCAKRLYPDFVN